MSDNKLGDTKEWYKHGWGLVAAILFFPYFIVWYAWAKSKWSKNLKIGITAVIAVIMLPLTLDVATTKPAETNNQQSSVANQPESKVTQEQIAQEEKNAAQKANEEKAIAEEKAAAEVAARKAPTSTGSSSASSTPAPSEPSSNLPFKAICNDGSVSYQDSPAKPDYRGMCSGHNGIKTKLGRTP